MAENNNQLTENEKKLLDTGFLNAISAIYQKLDDSEKENFSKIIINTVGENNLTAAIAENSNDSICPAGCDYVRGIGCVC